MWSIVQRAGRGQPASSNRSSLRPHGHVPTLSGKPIVWQGYAEVNYLAHAWNHLERAYFIAGTALPDWLSVVDRRVRLRRSHVEQWSNATDPPLAELAAGVQCHLDDDAWFHQHPAFLDLSWHFTVQLRRALPNDNSFRVSFLGHILVELLLDAALIEKAPDRLNLYYQQLDTVEPRHVVQAVEQMTGQRVEGLADGLGHFCRERFLYDYLDDGKLLWRVNQVLRRVGLAPLDDSLAVLLADFRVKVRMRCDELLVPPKAPMKSLT